MNMLKRRSMLCVALCGWLAVSHAQAPVEKPAEKLASADDSKLSFKLTPSWYRSSDGNNATDINLRANLDDHTAWLGFYRDKSGFTQSRTGYENRIDANIARLVLSIQAASRGFVGGSVNAEIGGETYAIVGFGRTNLRDYVNLNFDPNDAITLGIGSRAIAGTELTLFHLWDDRLSTHQRVTHAVMRHKFGGNQRLTLDVARKSGNTSDGAFVRGNAGTVTYDVGAYFGRIARDQYANFTGQHQTRVSLGMRF